MGCSFCKSFWRNAENRKFAAGIVVLLIVVLLWVGSAELTQVGTSHPPVGYLVYERFLVVLFCKNRIFPCNWLLFQVVIAGLVMDFPFIATYIINNECQK